MEDLPVEVQPVIMSLLPLKEAVRTGIVSTSWRMLWRSHCNLCFDGPNEPDSDTDDEFAGQDSTKMKRAKFIDTVNSVVQQHSGIGVNMFSIRCGLPKEDSDHLDRWISFATSSKEKIIHFDLIIIDWPLEEVHHFPLEALDGKVRSILLVRILHVQAIISKYAQKLPTRPRGMFMNLRHMTCQLSVDCTEANDDNEVLQLAHCLDAAPRLICSI